MSTAPSPVSSSKAYVDKWEPIFIEKPSDLKAQLANLHRTRIFPSPDQSMKTNNVWWLYLESAEENLSGSFSSSGESLKKAIYVRLTNPQIKLIERLVTAILLDPEYKPVYASTEEIIEALEASNFNPEFLTKEQKSHHETMLRVMKFDIRLLGVSLPGEEKKLGRTILGENLRDSFLFMHEMLKLNPRACRAASSRLQNNFTFMKQAQKNDPRAHRHAGADLKQNAEFMELAYTTDPQFFSLAMIRNLDEYIGENLRKDSYFCCKMLKIDRDAYKIVHPDLKTDSCFAIALLEAYRCSRRDKDYEEGFEKAFDWISPSLRDHEDVRKQGIGLNK